MNKHRAHVFALAVAAGLALAAPAIPREDAPPAFYQPTRGRARRRKGGSPAQRLLERQRLKNREPA